MAASLRACARRGSVHSSTLTALLAGVGLACFLACGHKGPVRPPELAAPAPIEDLVAEPASDGVKLRWSRPSMYVDGRPLDDLGGFVVLRSSVGSPGADGKFTPLVLVPVDDRDRFQQARKFRYTDTKVAEGAAYRYRIRVLTLNGNYSIPSNTVQLVWPGSAD